MPYFDEKPTKELISDVERYLTEVWSDAHAQWSIWDSYRERNFQIWDTTRAGQRSTYRPSTPTAVIDHAADTQMAFTPRVHRFPVGDSQSHRDSADRIESAMVAILEDSALHEMLLTWKQVGRHLLHYGYSPVEGPMLDFTEKQATLKREPGETSEEFETREILNESRGKSWNPIRTRPVHPAQVLLDPTEKMPRVALKSTQMNAQDLYEVSLRKKRTRKNADIYSMDGKKPYDKVVIKDFWTRKWHAVMAEGGEILWIERNTWGYVPYSHAFSGMGMEPMNISQFNPKYLAQGLLAPILDSIKLEAQQLSAKHTLLINAAYAPFITSSDPAEIGRQIAESGVVQVSPDEVGVMPTKDVTRWMFEVGRETSADIERGTYTRSLAGQREPGVSTVGQQAILSTAAQRKFAAPAIQLQHLASITASRILQLVDVVLHEPIGARGRVLDCKDIYGNFNALVTFEVIDPVLELQRRELGMREVMAGLKDMETYWEQDARIENVAELKRRLLRDKIRNSPAVLARLAQEEAKQMGLEDIFDDNMAMAAVEESRGAPGGAPGGAPPPVPESVMDQFMSPETEGGRFTDLESPRGVEQAARELRKPLTPDTVSPRRLNLG